MNAPPPINSFVFQPEESPLDADLRGGGTINSGVFFNPMQQIGGVSDKLIERNDSHSKIMEYQDVVRYDQRYAAISHSLNNAPFGYYFSAAVKFYI